MSVPVVSSRACPFCAGTNLVLGDDSREVREGETTTPLIFWVECATWACRARGPRSTSADAAVRDWGLSRP